jgi:phage/plasmid-like protein (TIGR03299 family)
MAHNLEVNAGVASYVENGRKERAWHGLGQVFDGPMTVKEALELSHADYTVQLQPVVALSPDILKAMETGEKIDPDLLLSLVVKNRKATMRMDKEIALGVVSDAYGVVQNADAFKFIDTLCSGELGDSHTPIIETAGVLGQGERVFITAKFPEDIILDNKTDDRVEMYVVFTTSHDGTGAVNCLVTPTRVVCNNTLNFAMTHNVGKMSLRHSSGIMNRLDLTRKENAEFAYKTLNMYETYKKSMEQRFAHLQNIKVSEKWLDEILAEVLLSEKNLEVYKATGNVHHEDITTIGKNLVDKVKQSVETGIGQEYGERGTGMWLINGITTYYQNEASFRSEESKFDSLMQGNAAKKVQLAYDLLTA